MNTPHEYKENKLSPGNCIACGLSFASNIHTTVVKLCCPKCDVSSILGASDGCANPSCPCHTPQKEEVWVKDFFKLYKELGLHLGYTRGDEVKKLTSFISSLLAKDQKVLDDYVDAQYKAGVEEVRLQVLIQLREVVEKYKKTDMVISMEEYILAEISKLTT